MGFGVSPKQSFKRLKFANPRRFHQRPRRACSPNEPRSSLPSELVQSLCFDKFGMTVPGVPPQCQPELVEGSGEPGPRRDAEVPPTLTLMLGSRYRPRQFGFLVARLVAAIQLRFDLQN